MRLRAILTICTATAVAAAFWPAAGGAATFRGVVVAKQRGSVLVASPGGVLRAATGRAQVGSRVAVAGRGAVVVGHADGASIRGIVVRRIGKMLFLSSNRHLVAIHDRVAATPAPAPATPAQGAVVATQVTIANGHLELAHELEVGHAASVITVEATISAVAAGSVTLSVQGQPLTVPLPGGLTLPASLVGQTVTVQLRLNDDNDDNDDNHDVGDDDHHDDHGGDSSGGDHGGGDHGGGGHSGHGRGGGGDG